MITDIDIQSKNDSNSIYQVTLNCDEMEDKDCIDVLNYLDKKLIENIVSAYDYKVVVLDSPSVEK